MSDKYFKLLCVWSTIQLVAADRPYVNDPECPRKPELIRDRKCLKKCKTNADCRGRNKECLCDDVCGKGCVKPTRRCETLKPVFNGKYDIKPFNTFGARVRYSCDEGYILSGLPERVCQGDGYWSGKPPTCESEATHTDWSSIEGKCHKPPEMQHARHDGPKGQIVFPLGTQLTYSCDAGYNIDGFFRAMCVGEGRWVGPRMTCSPRRCGHPGDITNGQRFGKSFSFPDRVVYECLEGFELMGRKHRVCQANGQWSGTRPQCRPVRCNHLTAPSNGNIYGSSYTYGSIVRFSCFRGFKLLGSQVRHCQQDGAWSGDGATCTMVDCGFPGPFYNGYLDGQQTTFGAIIIFRCFGRTTFEGESISTTCLANGEWSHKTPRCWSNCEIPSVHNATTEGFSENSYVSHGTKVTFTCNPGHSMAQAKESVCRNGTWTFLPTCEPAACSERPPDIRNGIVRYYTMEHGSRARYHCATGYTLHGDSDILCQFGRWVGKSPECHPVFCPYPGTLEHGRIMLVGVIGKYEYRPYVARIGHNEQIEFQCDKGYKLIGPKGATCVDGKWSPERKPLCQPGQHPKIRTHLRR